MQKKTLLPACFHYNYVKSFNKTLKTSSRSWRTLSNIYSSLYLQNLKLIIKKHCGGFNPINNSISSYNFWYINFTNDFHCFRNPVLMALCFRYQTLAFNFDETVDMTSSNARLLLVRLKMEGWAVGATRVFLKYYMEEYLNRWGIRGCTRREIF